jgi:hypothetical protein
MYGYVRANLTGTCQDECVRWHDKLEDEFDAADVEEETNAAICNLLKTDGVLLKQSGCS